MKELETVAIGIRIREVRGSLTQAAFADRLGLERKSVIRYESGERAPDALALLRLMTEFGADPAWVLTGMGANLPLEEDERELLAHWRSAPLAVKAAAIGALQGGSAMAEKLPAEKKQKQVVRGSVGQLAGGDVINKRGIKIEVGKDSGGRRKR